MVGYFVLAGALLILLLMSLRLSKWELFAPAPLFAIGMLVSTLLAIAGWGSWNTVDLKPEAILVVMGGSLFLCLGSCLVYGRFSLGEKHHKHVIYYGNSSRLLVNDGSIQIWKYIPLVTIVLIAIFLRVSETFEIAASLGVRGSYSECAAAVRNATASIVTAEATKFGTGFSFVERQLEKLVTAVGYVGAYLLARSLTRKGGKKSEIALSSLLLLLVCGFALAKGGRGDIIMYVIAVVVIWYLLKLRDVDDVRVFTLHAIAACAMLAVLLAATLYLTGSLVGRKAGSGFFEYITFYFGGSVPSLQILLDQGAPAVEPGVRTFYGLSNLAYKFGFVEAFPSYSIAWIDAGGHSSNIFTCFARYYLDYGFAGVAVLSLLSGALLAFVYRWARRSESACVLAVVGMLSPYIFDMAREEFVFSRLLSIHQAVTIALIVLLVLFVSRPVMRDLKRLASKLGHRSGVVE